MNRLFFICPECFIEQAIRDSFDGNTFMLTSLGAIVDSPSLDYATAIADLVEKENITEICVVNDAGCTFIKEGIRRRDHYSAPAAEYLANLFEEHIEDIPYNGSIEDIQKSLAAINVERQLDNLRAAPVLGDKIAAGNISLKAYVYDKVTGEFAGTEKQPQRLRA